VILSLFKQYNYMIRIFALAILTLTVSVSRAGTGPYQPATKPEKIEFTHDRLDLYPNDFRKDPAGHAGAAVAWVGIIRSTDARELDTDSKIMMDSVFEHHYFDWVQDSKGGLLLSVSPRGEGLFRAKWYTKKTDDDASAASAEKFARPGKLAIFYGVPEKIDTNGTVVLKYRYLRILGTDHFSTNEFDYGRLGEEPLREIHPQLNATCKTNSPTTQSSQPQPRWVNSPR
jgi:hypothetical protein